MFGVAGAIFDIQLLKLVVYVEFCIQELPEAMPAAKRGADNSAKLFVVSEATQLAVVATVH